METNEKICQTLFSSMNELVREVANELEQQNVKIVLAESCTAGLAAALLAQVPGISQWLCGSAVTYQESVKQEWLQIDPQLIQQHTAVSSAVSRQMATAVLAKTAAANFSVAITGHLEPSATERGAEAFIAIAYRKNDSIHCARSVHHRLTESSRVNRQWEAARAVMSSTMEYLRY